MKKILFILLIVATACVFQIAGSQTVLSTMEGKDSLSTRANVFTQARDDNPPVVDTSPVMLDPEESKILEALTEAKKRGDIAAARALQACLDELNGIVPYSSTQEEIAYQVVVVNDLAEEQPFANAAWGGDICVTNANDTSTSLLNPSMDEAPNGDLYIAVEEYYEAEDTRRSIRVYKSTDGGETWGWVIGFSSEIASYQNPSLAYATGTENWVFIAYERIEADETRSVEIFRFNPASPTTYNYATIASGISIPTYNDIKPEICTESLYYNYYWVYVTYDVYAVNYYLAYFSRSTDFGLTWSAPVDVTGGIFANSEYQTIPDIAYGPSGLYIAFEKKGWDGSDWVNQIWVTKSTNYGTSWNTPIQLTATSQPNSCPRIAVASNGSVMVTYTRQYGHMDTDVQSYYSTDSGTNWYFAVLPWTDDYEWVSELSVSNNNGRFHTAFWQETGIWYSWAYATNPELGWSDAIVVNELNATAPFRKPAVCTNPTLPVDQEACVAWPDFFNYYYDVYFDQVSTCGNGVLEGGEDCDDGNTLDGDCCNAECTFEPYGSPCDNPDSTDCSAPDTCNGDGFCSANDYPEGTQCTDDGNMCTDDACNDYGICLHYPNTDPCDDGNACTIADTCSNWSCESGPALNCDDGNVCTTDSCNPASGCVHANNTLSCSDGLYCNGTDTCSGGSCSIHSNNPCSGGPVCNNTCNETNDNCFTSNGNVCTDDGNVCTNDICNGSGSCTHPNNTDPCDDGLFCNGTDTCSGGTCSDHSGDPCFPLLCDEDTNTCSGGSDFDGDGVPDSLDNCTYQYNPGQEDLDSDGIGDACDNCPRLYNQYQEDTYPPQTNGCGDVCECEGNFNGWEDEDVDGTDAFTFKQDFGRSRILDPCTNADPCNGDFTCDYDVDGTDAFTFKSDFGRSNILNPCPYCVTIPWCNY